MPPPAPRFFAPEFDGHRAEDEPAEQGHEGQVKPGKNPGIDHGEGGKEGAGPGDQPDLIAVPDRPDGIEEDAAVFVLLDQKVQRADPEVEAVEHGVAGEKDADENEPDGVEVGHGVINRRRGPGPCAVP